MAQTKAIEFKLAAPKGENTERRFVPMNTGSTASFHQPSWGGSYQNFNGLFFLSINPDEKNEFRATHGVQPNNSGTAPKGWVPTDKPGIFKRNNIGFHRLKHEKQTLVFITADGQTEISQDQEMYLVCNLNDDGSFDLTDVWRMSVEEFEKKYNPLNP